MRITAEYKDYPKRNRQNEVVIYKDERYTLGQQNDSAYIIANANKYILSCHPYEPCLYITDCGGSVTAVHNAFDPFVVLEVFSGGDTITSITGFEYSAKDFCRMVEYAAGLGNINIDDAEKVFGNKEKNRRCIEKKVDKAPQVSGTFVCPKGVSVIEKDLFYDTVEQYPDSVIDYCLVKGSTSYSGIDSHWEALLAGALHIIADDWKLSFTPGKIGAKAISAEEFFSSAKETGKRLNYKSAFLYPPYPVGYTDKDFERINGALFPNGTDNLEIYKWTTDWSDYFDDGHEWWGALCYTVYDETLDRFVVIMASATD